MAESTERDINVSQQPIPLPQTGALTPPDMSQDDVESLAAPPDMGAAIAQHQIAAGKINHGNARDWAENAVAGVQAALAGFGAAGTVPAGAGALYGVGAAARQMQERQDKQKQQAFANKMAQQKQMTEQQVAQAQIAHLNAEQHNLERLSRDADEEHMQKMLEFDQTAAQPFIEAGTRSMGEHLTSDDLQRMLKTGPSGKSEINGHEALVFRDGLAPSIGRDGKPVLDSTTGQPVMRPTYRLFEADGPGVKFDDEQVKLISENTPYKPKPGVEVDPVSAYTILTQAKKNQAVNLNIQKVQAEIGEKQAQEGKAKEETTDKQEQRQLEQKAAKIFSPYLSQANGDPWRAIQLMGKDPAARAQVGVIEQAYGPGNIEKWHHDQQEIAIRAEELKQKKQANLDFVGDQNAPTSQAFLSSLPPEAQSVVNLIHEGRAPLHNPAYLLARKPEVLAAVEKAFPGEFDASKVEGYQQAYKEFTSEKATSAGGQLLAGASLLNHLADLKRINNANPTEVRIPGTQAYNHYQSIANQAADEIANFYGEAKTEQGKEANLANLTRVYNRNAGIEGVATTMGKRLDNMEQTWREAAPSRVYEAPMPHIDEGAKRDRALVDPEYRARISANVPVGSVRVQIPGQPPGYVPQANLDAFRKAHPDAQVIQ